MHGASARHSLKGKNNAKHILRHVARLALRFPQAATTEYQYPFPHSPVKTIVACSLQH
jgi:hypothetical protein